MSNIINFYRAQDEFGEFSNFALYPIKVDGKIWPTSEHYFQAQKFKDINLQETVKELSQLYGGFIINNKK